MKRSASGDSLNSFISYTADIQGFLAVPAELAPEILKNGYKVSTRTEVPITLVNDSRQAALAMLQHNAAPETVVLEVREVSEDSIDRQNSKLKMTHLPAKHLSNGIIMKRGDTQDFAKVPCPVCGASIPELAQMRGRVGEYVYLKDAVFRCTPCPSPACQQALTERQTRLSTEGPTTLYHQTNRKTADAIKESGKMFRGTGGAVGGGVYFAETVRETEWKAEHHGVVLECEVNLGRVKDVDGKDKKPTPIIFAQIIKDSFDSVKLDRGTVLSGKHEGDPSGNEYVVYSWDQVKVLREVPREKPCACCEPKAGKA